MSLKQSPCLELVNLNVVSFKCECNLSSEGQCLFILLSMAKGFLRGVADGDVEGDEKKKKVWIISVQMAAVSKREKLVACCVCVHKQTLMKD